MSVTGFNRRRRELELLKLKEEIKEDIEEKQYFSEMTVKELKALCKEKGLEGYSELKKDEIILLLQANE